MNGLIKNTFQVPNIILDEYLKILSSNEFIILITVVRKTIGWRKKKDSISISQFQQITGLSNRVVIKCCKSLIDKKLLLVTKGNRNINIFTLNEKSLMTKSHKNLCKKVTRTYDEKSQEPMTKSHTQNPLNKTQLNPLNKSSRKKIKFIRPKLQEIQQYAITKQRDDLTEKFFEYYNSNNWEDKYGNKVKNWKLKFLVWTNHSEKKKIQVNDLNLNYSEGSTC